MTTTSSEHRLHPLSIVFELGRQLPRMVVPFIVLLAATWDKSGRLFVLSWLATLVTFLFAIAIIRYVRYRYRYDAHELVIRSGLLFRNERLIPYARIQNIDAAQNPLHRLLGVAVVHVQTGSGMEPEAALRVLPMAALHEMRARVLAAGVPTASVAALPMAAAETADPDEVSENADGRTLLALEPGELLLAGFLENRGMVLIFGALALLDQTGAASRFIERMFETPDTVLGDLAARFPGFTGLPVMRGAVYFTIALLIIVLFIRVISTLWAVIRLYGFRLELRGDDLHTEYGLFTRVTATIPLRRVQTIVVRHGVLHRMLGRCTVMVETAGGIVMDGSAPPREAIAPLLRTERLPALLHELHPGLDPDAIEWRPVHRRAFGRIVRRGLLVAAGVSAAAWFMMHGLALALFVALGTLTAITSLRRARYLAWAVTSDAVAVRDGAFMRATRIARFSRVQVAALYRSPVDLRTGMARVRADTAGLPGGVVIPFLPADTADQLRAELLERASATAFTW